MPTPSKFTADRRQIGLQIKRLGASDRSCARAMGVDHEALRRWLVRGKDAPEGSQYREFYELWEAATAHPNVRALESVYAAIPDRPDLALKLLERLEPGWAPPQTAVARAPQINAIQLVFADGSPAAPGMIEGVVIEQESPAGGDVRGLPAPSGAA